MELLGATEPEGAGLLTKAVPPLDCNEDIATGKQAEKHPARAKIGKLAVDDLVLDQRAYLLVKHLVELRNQHDGKAKFPVLGKKFEPFHPARVLPPAGVEKDLRFINVKVNAVLLKGELFALKEVPAGFHDQGDGKIVVRKVEETVRVFQHFRIDIKIAKHAALPRSAAPPEDVPCKVERFATSGSSGI